MDIKNKIVIGAIILLLALFTAHLAEAGGGVSIGDIDVYYDCETYEGEIVLENYCDRNITAFVEVYVDDKSILCDNVELNVRYFKGFRIRTHETVYFEAPCEEGKHKVRVTVIVDNISLLGNVSYIAHGCMEDLYEEEDVEDWLGCP